MVAVRPAKTLFYTFSWTNVFLPNSIYNFATRSFTGVVAGETNGIPAGRL